MTKRTVENRLDDLEDEHGGDDVEDMDTGELYMRMLRANAEGDEEREAEAWNEYQRRVEALESDTADVESDGGRP